MPLDILTIGEALVEVMRTGIDQPLNRPGPFSGPYPSGAPFIFAVQAARLGMKSAAIDSVGADAFGDCLLPQLEAARVVTDGIRPLPDQPPGIAFVPYNSDCSRTFVFSLAASRAPPTCWATPGWTRAAWSSWKTRAPPRST